MTDRLMMKRSRGRDGSSLKHDSETLWYYRVGFTIFFLVQAGVAIWLSLDTFGEPQAECTWLGTVLRIDATYRTNAGVKDPSFGVDQYWGGAAITDVGPLNPSFVIALASAAQFFWLAASWFMSGDETMHAAADYNPFRWWRFAFSHGLVWLGVAVLAGVSNVWNLVFIVALTAAWLYDFSKNESHNARDVRLADLDAGKGFGSVSSWRYVDSFVAALAKFVVVAVAVYVHLGYAAGNDAFDADAVSLPTVAYITPILGGVVYLALPIIVWLHHADTDVLQSPLDKEIALYWFNFVFITAATWLTLGFSSSIGCPPDV